MKSPFKTLQSDPDSDSDFDSDDCGSSTWGHMNNPADIQGCFVLRRCILETLYGFFREYPYGLAELHLFQEQCQCSPEALNWNIVYLEKCGLVELDKSMDCPPYVSCTAAITAQGIELVENPAQFDKKFPHHQAT